jgi:hypothetical protein
MTDEQRLIEKLARVEALFAGATTDGERVAAAEARTRILARLREVERDDPPVEHRFKLTDVWARRLLLALLRRYDLDPYRYSGQRHTTVMVRAPRRFVQETLWPEYTELHDTLHRYLHDVTERVIAQVVRADTSDAAEVAEPRGLPAARGPR